MPVPRVAKPKMKFLYEDRVPNSQLQTYIATCCGTQLMSVWLRQRISCSCNKSYIYRGTTKMKLAYQVGSTPPMEKERALKFLRALLK